LQNKEDIRRQRKETDRFCGGEGRRAKKMGDSVKLAVASASIAHKHSYWFCNSN
jgi:hypothetical protein